MERLDEIRRMVVIDAPIDVVWDAVTKPDQIAQWFGDIAEIEPRPGGAARFGWTEFSATFEASVVAMEPPHHFAYRWSLRSGEPFSVDSSALVEFTLEQTGNSTTLTLVESGFATLEGEAYESYFAENSDGWDIELGELVEYLGASSVV